MQRYLQKEQDRSLSSSDIMHLTDGQCRIMEYGELSGARDIADVLSPSKPLVLLYESQPNYGHWCCVLDRGSHCEFFDSYGVFPDNELRWTSPEMRAELGESQRYLTQLLRGTPVVYNNVELQNKKANTCGRWVSARIILQHLPPVEFATQFATVPGYSPDEAVVLFTPLHHHSQPLVL